MHIITSTFIIFAISNIFVSAAPVPLHLEGPSSYSNSDSSTHVHRKRGDEPCYKNWTSGRTGLFAIGAGSAIGGVALWAKFKQRQSLKAAKAATSGQGNKGLTHNLEGVAKNGASQIINGVEKRLTHVHHI
ncbi:hypothetical protein FRB94_011742 [Tulasnella sp. JGI-2019a]|nr:hypothetical protein FRB93_010229 [Tulasnella sp. JGI-2019a]KAG8992256.1 hypothetical protein FRB94_011742 [Tulasnella sp. JGI-2019a]KAG9021673.1 hypothetical protein FRB95_001675 [Tulasnella sp. JGI-2019a]